MITADHDNPAPGPSRDMIFLSHATPEDNEFARWLALQLANEGYPVWCDLTKLLGGEDFWKDIQEAIRTHTVRFLFVLSRSSNTKDGTLQELACAKAVAAKLKAQIRDFIIALKIDDLPYSDVDIEIQRLNHVSFATSWAAGLRQLVAKLEQDRIPKDPRYNPDAVCSWWRSQAEFSAEQGVVRAEESLLSNWLRFEKLPDQIWIHDITRRGIGKIDFDVSGVRFPAAKASDLSFLTFAQAEQVADDLDGSIYIHSSKQVKVADILGGSLRFGSQLVNILRQGWERMMRIRGFSVQDVSPRPARFFYLKDKILSNRLHFTGVMGDRTYRDIVGYKTVMGTKRYWHYAISGKPELHPYLHMVIRGHVLFSSAGDVIWEDSQKAAKARRNQCKGWWNDEWRDRMLAVVQSLWSPAGTISIPMAPDCEITMCGAPELFTSPVSYTGKAEVDDNADDYFDDEDEEKANQADEPVDSPA
jgi:TIR domain